MRRPLQLPPSIVERLGKASDSALAAEVGCGTETIRRRRLDLGVSACGVTVQIAPELESQLGKMTDLDMSRLLGCTKSSARNIRVARGVASFKKSKLILQSEETPCNLCRHRNPSPEFKLCPQCRALARERQTSARLADVDGFRFKRRLYYRALTPEKLAKFNAGNARALNARSLDRGIAQLRAFAKSLEDNHEKEK